MTQREQDDSQATSHERNRLAIIERAIELRRLSISSPGTRRAVARSVKRNKLGGGAASFRVEAPMWLRVSDAMGFAVEARDGYIGGIDDFLFDDAAWRLRWAVIDTGNWLPGRRVLLPPAALRRIQSDTDAYVVDLTTQVVKDSPSVEMDLPVSRQMEANLCAYYGWAPYWAPPASLYRYAPPAAAAPIFSAQAAYAAWEAAGRNAGRGDPHLRSTNELTGYCIEASDGPVGHVEDLLVNDEAAAVRYIVVDTKDSRPGKKVLISPGWINEISWNERHFGVRLMRAAVKASPEFEPAKVVDRAYEQTLYRHYGFRPYWA